MNKLIDIHCHGLPLVDDGVQSEDSALFLLKQAVESKISCIYMTPHMIKDGKFFAPRSMIDDKLKRVQDLAKDNHLPIDIKLGSEIMISESGLKYIQEEAYWGYQDSDYVLIEFMVPLDQKLISEALYELKRQGKRVIIAHPERYFKTTQEALISVTSWKKAGAFFHINRTSLLAPSSASIYKISTSLIQHNLIACVASDAHHAPGRRECRLDDVYDLLGKRFDTHTADLLCIYNPSCIASNQPMASTKVPSSLLAHLLTRLKLKSSS